MKKQLAKISALPSKRIYLSIIADYHLHLALCELIDNAIDNWIINGKLNNLKIDVDLDYDQQSITVEDNSGGIKEEDISLIVAPGLSRMDSSNEVIGTFGVGSKRAVIALSKQIRISSRYKNDKTLLVEIDESWITDHENWELQTFEIDQISSNSTKIEMNILREKIEEVNHSELTEILSTTYALFLANESISIFLNDIKIEGKFFENWSFPPDFEPIKKSGPIVFKDKEKIDVEIIGGLTKSHRDDNFGIEEYGVYFYFNNRLISRAYKGREVGFSNPPVLGKPHPNLSLVRVIVKLSGSAELMPWNSSKSSVDFKHRTFQEINEHIKRVLTTYATMSKNWSGNWPEKVFNFKNGAVKEESLTDFSSNVRLHIPKILRKERTPKYIDLIKKINSDLSKLKPWVVGLYEAIIAVDEIAKLKLEQSNRICLLILDSTLEIGFKEFLLNESGNRYSDNRIANFSRVDLQSEVKKNSRLKSTAWKIIDSYYLKRCDLVHKRSTTQISDNELENYREVVEYTLTKLFKIKFNNA